MDNKKEHKREKIIDDKQKHFNFSNNFNSLEIKRR